LKQLCVHGHFCLPPRRDPFSGTLPHEASAAPFRNIYEQTTADCYRPNAVLGNFDLLSFDLAPALLDWLAAHDAATYNRVLAADRGNAMATAFHHVTLPLHSRRDKITQITWGLRAFECHFGRPSAGLWLPEMAVDEDTLDALAECGVRFTLLSSEQAPSDLAQDAGPYRVRLSTGRELAVFVRDRALSDKVSFELSWLGGAGMFAAQYLAPQDFAAQDIARRASQALLLIASAGETYGHHHADEEMFLRYLLRQEAARVGYQIVPLAGYLRDHPPQREIGLVFPSSWSCAHGVQRWQDECGCAAPAAWKAPLRAALNRLAEAADDIYERATRRAYLDPWQLRDCYAEVLTMHVPGPVFLDRHVERALTRPDQDRLLTLLDAQFYRMAMFDSHTFFGTEFGTPDMRYVLANLVRAVDLIADATGDDLAEMVHRDLAQVTDPRGERTATEIYIEITEAQHT